MKAKEILTKSRKCFLCSYIHTTSFFSTFYESHNEEITSSMTTSFVFSSSLQFPVSPYFPLPWTKNYFVVKLELGHGGLVGSIRSQPLIRNCYLNKTVKTSEFLKFKSSFGKILENLPQFFGNFELSPLYISWYDHTRTGYTEKQNEEVKLLVFFNT